ncbi:MAG: C40 family peptidase [Eubacterium sp.]|nr:C40 family peptidase [Eubacterium sp.]
MKMKTVMYKMAICILGCSLLGTVPVSAEEFVPEAIETTENAALTDETPEQMEDAVVTPDPASTYTKDDQANDWLEEKPPSAEESKNNQDDKSSVPDNVNPENPANENTDHVAQDENTAYVPYEDTGYSESYEESSKEDPEKPGDIEDLKLDITRKDHRFKHVDAKVSFANRYAYVFESPSDKARVIGILKESYIFYSLKDMGNGWLYMESGDVRGYIRTDVKADKDAAYEYNWKYVRIAVSLPSGICDNASDIVSMLYKKAQTVIAPKENKAYCAEHVTIGETVVAKQYAVVRDEALIIRDACDPKAKEVGTMKKDDLAYILETEENGWVFVESGDARGFIESKSVITGEDAKKIVEDKKEATMMKAKATVPADENKAFYHTFTSTQEYQEHMIDPRRKEIVEYAATALGVPYVWGGTDMQHGADCSGLSMSVYAHFGISIPRVAENQAQVGKKIKSENAQPGDLLFYADDTGYIHHVAICAGKDENGTMKTIEEYGDGYGCVSIDALGRDNCWAVDLLD